MSFGKLHSVNIEMQRSSNIIAGARRSIATVMVGLKAAYLDNDASISQSDRVRLFDIIDEQLKIIAEHAGD